MKISCILVYGLLITSASIIDCEAQNSVNSDVQLISEYLVINHTLDSVFSEPLMVLSTKAEIDVESLEIVTVIAKFESLIRSYQRLTSKSKKSLSELKSKIRSDEMNGYIESIESLFDEYIVSLSKAIEIFKEIDGSRYRFMTRTEELVELIPHPSDFCLVTDGMKKVVLDAAHRSLGW